MPVDTSAAVSAVAGSVVGSGLSSYLFKLLLGQWLKAEGEFKDWARIEIKNLRERVHSMGQIANTAVLESANLGRRVDALEEDLKSVADRLAGKLDGVEREFRIFTGTLADLTATLREHIKVGNGGRGA